jgi:Protein of unknown function (DUF3108)
MKSFGFLFGLILAVPSFAADQLTGFPFQSETLRYNIRFSSGASLGEATVSAQKTEAGGWRFDMSFNAGLPGVSFADSYRSLVTTDLCSNELERAISHVTKKVLEKTTFDQSHNMAVRQTINPAGGGRSDLRLPTCARDALAYQFFARREMGQGRVPEAGDIFFGGPYRVSSQYTGAMTIPVGNRNEVTDHLNVSIKGPASDVTIEIFYARDAARTPLLVRIPIALGKITLELVR